MRRVVLWSRMAMLEAIRALRKLRPGWTLRTPAARLAEPLWSPLRPSQALPSPPWAEEPGGRGVQGRPLSNPSPRSLALKAEPQFPRAHAPNHRSSDSLCLPWEGSSGRMKVRSRWLLHGPPLPKHTVKRPLTFPSYFPCSTSQQPRLPPSPPPHSPPPAPREA